MLKIKFGVTFTKNTLVFKFFSIIYFIETSTNHIRREQMTSIPLQLFLDLQICEIATETKLAKKCNINPGRV